MRRPGQGVIAGAGRERVVELGCGAGRVVGRRGIAGSIWDVGRRQIAGPSGDVGRCAVAWPSGDVGYRGITVVLCTPAGVTA